MELLRSRLLPLLVVPMLVAGACSSDDAADDTDDGAPDVGADSADESDADDTPAAPGSDTDTAADAAPAATADCAPARPAVSDPDRSFDDGTGPRSFRLAVPEAYDGSTAAPVILNIHGLQSNADQQAGLTGLEARGPESGYVVVSPNGATAAGADAPAGTGQFWDITMENNADVAFLEALLDELGTELCIDPDHVYATGMSNGGGMSAVLACLSDRVSAVVPVAGLNINSGCRPPEPVPIVAIHGDADIIVRYDADITVPEAMAEYAAAADCDAEPESTVIFEDVEHHVWTSCSVPVELYTVLGGGHTWPGRDLLAAVDESGADGDGPAGRFSREELAAILGHTSTNIDATELALQTFEAHRHGDESVSP